MLSYIICFALGILYGFYLSQARKDNVKKPSKIKSPYYPYVGMNRPKPKEAPGYKAKKHNK